MSFFVVISTSIFACFCFFSNKFASLIHKYLTDSVSQYYNMYIEYNKIIER